MLKPPKNQNDSASDTGSQNKISDKQKIGMLKRAVLDLREEKVQFEKTIADLSQKNNQLMQEKLDLDEKYNTLQRELQIQIQANQNKNSLVIPTPILKLDDSKTQNTQIRQLQQELKATTEQHEAQFSILQQVYKQLEQDLKSKDSIINKLNKELEIKNQENLILKKNIEDIERDLYNQIKDLKAQNMQIQLKIKTMEKEMQSKDDEIRVLHKGLDDSRFTVAQLQAELEETRGKFIQYKLTLHNQILDIECLFILRQNLYNDYIFELETAANKFVYKASDITDLKAKDEKSFYLSVKSRSKDEIFIVNPNQDLKKICKSIKNFLVKAQQYQLHKLQDSQVQSPSNNGLLSGFMSFFGSTSKNSNTNSEQKQK